MTPSNTELREALSRLKDVDSYRNGANYLSEETIDEILALFQAREQKMLTELLGKERAYNTPEGKWEMAVPVSVIERKIGELNG